MLGTLVFAFFRFTSLGLAMGAVPLKIPHRAGWSAYSRRLDARAWLPVLPARSAPSPA